MFPMVSLVRLHYDVICLRCVCGGGGKEALPDRLCLTRSLVETKNSAHASLVFFTDCNYFLRQKVPHTEELE